jgi:predicted aldo/keto reductase-like oxidoreductase
MKRRDFLKISGLSAIAAGSAGLLGSCRAGSENVQGKMTYRTNPGNNDTVSILGYGCMRWPMTEDEDGNEIVDQEMTNTLVDYALEHGINYFDAAPMYHDGECERVTGTALIRHPRETYYLATKLSNFKDASKEASMEMYRKSFRDLQTDYIDYYLLHSVSGIATFDRRFRDNGMIDFLVEERKAGRIRNLGFSFHGQKEGFDEMMALHETYHWDFVQIQLNYVDWTHASSRNTNAEYLMERLREKGIPAVIMEPLLGGKLAKLPEHLARRLKEKDPEKSLASWAFRFAGSHEGVLCVLSGMTYMEHLQDNLKTFSPLQTMNSQELAFMEETAELMQNYPTIECTQCHYCGCPYGLDIPLIFSHYNKCVNEGYISSNPESEGYRKARRAYLVSYDRAVPKQLQADHCIGCGQCVEYCPQGIDIPEEMRRIDRHIEALKRNNF